LIDDVAAVSCSTPTHAAEVAVPIDCGAARGELAACARRLHAQGHRAILTRARTLVHLARAPAQHLGRQPRHLHQLLRELRASARRGIEDGRTRASVQVRALRSNTARAATADRDKRRRDLARLTLALAAHDPERTLERGYALVQDSSGEALSSAAATRAAGELGLRFHDGTVGARVTVR
jgi:exodeoxyribonuclease VII large subunit